MSTLLGGPAPAEAKEPTPAGRTAPTRGARNRPRLRLALVLAVVLGAVAYLLFEGLGSSLDYFDTVDQALAQKASLGTSTLRLEGLVVAGSIRPTAVGTNFVVSDGGQRVPVENRGSPPNLFQSGIPVVVVGHFASAASRTFVSDQIMVKHSADYIAAHPGRVKGANGSVQ